MDLEETLRANLKQYQEEKLQIVQLVQDAKDEAVKKQLETILSELCDAIKHTSDSILGLKKVKLLENIVQGKYQVAPSPVENSSHLSTEGAQDVPQTGEVPSPRADLDGSVCTHPVGSKCQVMWYSEGGSGEWMDAAVFRHLGSEEAAVGRDLCANSNAGQGARVVVTLTTPTFLYMKSCRFLSRGTCRYGSNCRFSHGFTVPISRLRPFVKDDRELKIGDACLAMYHQDELWYPAAIVEAEQEGFCVVAFDGFEGTEVVRCGDVILPPEVCQHATGSSVEESTELSDIKEEQLWESGSGQVRNLSDETESSIGAWEVHTKGFGSRMLSKMGFQKGSGLGKRGQGVLVPVGFNKVVWFVHISHIDHRSLRATPRLKIIIS